MKKIAIIVGSLRKGSFTKQIANYMKNMFPEGFNTEFIDIAELPMYNQDFDLPGNTPQNYVDFRKEIASADGFIFATPEYNRSYPAVIKNALDIASRPYGQNLWKEKPAILISVSPGAIGAFGASAHLRHVLSFLDVQLMQSPELYIGNVQKLIEKDGSLNESTSTFLQSSVENLLICLSKL
ncbi:MAG: NAD(P)H-dependent oxidoreductase [Christensenellaceae bacterium]|nr:NAD(P)H-dependent oxidoreductase [Christensenellaceae bacterium]